MKSIIILILINFHFNNLAICQDKENLSRNGLLNNLSISEDSILKSFKNSFQQLFENEKNLISMIDTIQNTKLKNAVLIEYTKIFDKSINSRNAFLACNVEYDYLPPILLSKLNEEPILNQLFINEILYSFLKMDTLNDCNYFDEKRPFKTALLHKLPQYIYNIKEELINQYNLSTGCRKNNFKKILNEMVKQKFISTYNE